MEIDGGSCATAAPPPSPSGKRGRTSPPDGMGAPDGKRPSKRGRNAGVLGKYLWKGSPSVAEAPHSLLGKVVSCCGRTCSILYEDGFCEDLETSHIHQRHVDKDSGDNNFLFRKTKLDSLIFAGDSTARRTRSRLKSAPVLDSCTVEASSPPPSPSSVPVSESGEDDVDSSSDSCDSVSAHYSMLEPQLQYPPLVAPPLPPSSCDIGIIEEAVPCLLSVYCFLRSFSHQLFLSPFTLDDFVSSLNCSTHSSLLDAIHVSLMRCLRRHLTALSSDGSQIASRCLKLIDWSLLDIFTWPVFVIRYMAAKGHHKQTGFRDFFIGNFDGDYYRLPVGFKLNVLQILCDDVAQSADLRDELATRENMDEERDCNTSTNNSPPECGPTRVHPRYSKTSACRDTDVLEHEVTPDMMISKARHMEPDGAASDNGQDGNSDDCWLCGMDGMLICCDGCPSAYHSRCIGLNKAYLPEGSWYCPECTIRKIGPAMSKIATGIRGAESFGMDPFGRFFLGVCNYLLVIDVSLDAKVVSRYYNHNDVIKILQLFYSTRENSSIYTDIGQEISLYWQIPLVSKFSQSDGTGALNDITAENADAVVFSHLCLSSAGKSEAANYTSYDKIARTADRKLEPTEYNFVDTSITKESLDSVDLLAKKSQMLKIEFPECSSAVVSEVDTCEESVPGKGGQNQLGIGLAMSTVTSNTPYFISGYSHLKIEAYTAGPANSSNKEDVDLMVFQANNVLLNKSCDSICANRVHKGKGSVKSEEPPSIGKSFKRQAYVNLYIHGEFAASAAANFALLATEESKLSDIQANSNPRKVIAASVALQIKAFSQAEMPFFWPGSEKKITERCGWCMACKSSATWKRGCFLNNALTNGAKCASKALNCFRPQKIDNNCIPAIAAYILHMEENLHGLTDGILLVPEYCVHWRQSVMEATNCMALKSLLLQFEKNIRAVAFSNGWHKPVDDFSADLSCMHDGACYDRTLKKRGMSGRRGRKPSSASEVTYAASNDNGKQFQWRRGGKMIKFLFLKAALPRLEAIKVARQGGVKEISGINYSDCFETANRTRQIAWRVSVEKTKGASELGLQVRYLDAYLRWKDMARPEQVPSEGKAMDTETSALRNATIDDKKVVDNKTIYALTFGNQKHLPSRVMKNVLQTDRGQDDKEKLWFSENYVPLYLIKEYEGKIKMMDSPPLKNVVIKIMPEFQRRQLEALRKNIFLYLSRKRDKLVKYSCAFCKVDVLLRDGAKCRTCHGYVHRFCLMPLCADMKTGLESNLICKRCYRAEFGVVSEFRLGGLKPQFLSQQNHVLHNAKTNGLLARSPVSQPTPAKTEVLQSCLSQPDSKRKRKNTIPLTYGLIWKRKSSSESCTDYQRKHLLLGGRAGMESLEKPICRLCSLPYNPDLIYLRCEKCLNWYHADSVKLGKEQIPDLIGFKCCKCRRKTSPTCPYMDPDIKKQESKYGGNGITDGNQDRQQQSVLSHVNSTSMCSLVSEEPTLLATATHLIQYAGDPGEISVDIHQNYALNDGEMTTSKIEYGISSMCGYVSAPSGSHSNIADEMFATEDAAMEYEPQTYFSFTELLASEDDQIDGLFDMSAGATDSCLPSGFDDRQRGEPTVSFNPESCEVVLVEQDEASKPLAFDGLQCQKCKLSQPAPHVCEVCGLIIHDHCTPWEKMDPTDHGMWRCGDCREWQ